MVSLIFKYYSFVTVIQLLYTLILADEGVSPKAPINYILICQFVKLYFQRFGLFHFQE